MHSPERGSFEADSNFQQEDPLQQTPIYEKRILGSKSKRGSSEANSKKRIL
jgi:hypothetical protein